MTDSRDAHVTRNTDVREAASPGAGAVNRISLEASVSVGGPWASLGGFQRRRPAACLGFPWLTGGAQVKWGIRLEVLQENRGHVSIGQRLGKRSSF